MPRLAMGALCAALIPFAAALAETQKPSVNCSGNDSFTNCSTSGEGTFEVVMAAVHVLGQRPASEDRAIIEKLTRDKDTLPPPFLYELAARSFATNKLEAGYYFGLAGTRGRYDAFRCRDKTASAGIGMSLMVLDERLKPMMEYFRAHQKELAQAYRLVRDRNDGFNGKASPWWICSHGMMAVSAGMSGKALREEDWLKPESEWPAIRDSLNKGLDKTIEQLERGGN